MERYFQHFNQGQWLDWVDIVVGPIYFLAIFILGNQFKNQYLASSPIKKFFARGLALKLIGSVASALVYQYYYHGGDTFNFYTSASYVNSITFNNPEDAFLLLSDMPIDQYPQLIVHQPYLDFVYDSASWFVVRAIILCSYFTFDTYIGTGLFFAVFSFYASWRFFSLISDLYPDLREPFFYCIFGIPSVIFWGSGIFKDTLTMGGLLLLLYHTFQIIILRKKILSNLLGLLLGFFIVFSIRKFFIVLVLPSFALWYFVSIRDRIKNRLLKAVSFPLLITISFGITLVGITSLTRGAGELSRGELTAKSKGFQSWHTEVGGSTYSLGDIDYSNVGILKTMPLAINVTLFRPYITEIHSFFQLVSALQSLFFLLFAIRVLIRARIFGFFSTLVTDSLALFSFFFSLLFAFVVGFTSFNFGALDRYKIPCLPFFMISLILVDYQWKMLSFNNYNKSFTTK